MQFSIETYSPDSSYWIILILSILNLIITPFGSINGDNPSLYRHSSACSTNSSRSTAYKLYSKKAIINYTKVGKCSIARERERKRDVAIKIANMEAVIFQISSITCVYKYEYI